MCQCGSWWWWWWCRTSCMSSVSGRKREDGVRVRLGVSGRWRTRSAPFIYTRCCALGLAGGWRAGKWEMGAPPRRAGNSSALRARLTRGDRGGWTSSPGKPTDQCGLLRASDEPRASVGGHSRPVTVRAGGRAGGGCVVRWTWLGRSESGGRCAAVSGAQVTGR
jgi:hypothetical protein